MVELTLLCVAASAEAVSDALIEELDALSASVEDADAGTDVERALFGEPGAAPSGGGWNRSVVRALFIDIDAARTAAARLLDAPGEHVQVRSIDPVADEVIARRTSITYSMPTTLSRSVR